MDTQTVPFSLISDAINFSNLYEVKPRTYSGRGMYGRYCFGLDVDSTGDGYVFMLALGIVAAQRDDVDVEELVCDLARAASTDSMGRGMILYFPGFELDSYPADEDADEDW